MLFEIQIKELTNGYLLRVFYKGQVEREEFYQTLREAYVTAKSVTHNYLCHDGTLRGKS